MEVIRFQCPACSAALTVPPAAAGFQGPCPKCSIEIIGPNPALGISASLPVAEPPPVKAFEPFPDSPSTFVPPEAPPLSDDPAAELIPPTDPFAGIAPAPESSMISWPEPGLESETAAETNNEGGTVDTRPLDKASESDEEPFKDFTPPTPSTEPSAAPLPIPAAKPASSSSAVLVLSCLLCGVLAFVAGFTAGRRIPEADSPIFSSKPNEPPAPAPEPVPVPVRTWIPNATPLDPDEPNATGPEATLRAFLNADGWAARSAYVMFPESIRQRMEAHSKVSDDGPIETIKFSLFEVTRQAHIFIVATSKVPEGFPIAVSRDNNSWQVDWQTFVEFHDDRFTRFASGKEGRHGVFHLLVKPTQADESEALFEKFLLNPPMPGREHAAYIKKGSAVLARAQSIFQRQAGLSEEVFNKLIEDRGPPMVLALSYKVNSEGQSYLQIEDVIAIGWGPGEP